MNGTIISSIFSDILSTVVMIFTKMNEVDIVHEFCMSRSACDSPVANLPSSGINSFCLCSFRYSFLAFIYSAADFLLLVRRICPQINSFSESLPFSSEWIYVFCKVLINDFEFQHAILFLSRRQQVCFMFAFLPWCVTWGYWLLSTGFVPSTNIHGTQYQFESSHLHALPWWRVFR